MDEWRKPIDSEDVWVYFGVNSPRELQIEGCSSLYDDMDQMIALPGLTLDRFALSKWQDDTDDTMEEHTHASEDERLLEESGSPLYDSFHGLVASKPPSKPVNLHEVLRRRFSGRKGNQLMMKLINMGKKEILRPKGLAQLILVNELTSFLNFSEKRNMRTRTPAQFNFRDILREKIGCYESTFVLEILHQNEKQWKKYSPGDRARAIKRYKSKKTRRNSAVAIRYDIRHKLARGRVRANGKFMKKQKVDLAEVAKELSRK